MALQLGVEKFCNNLAKYVGRKRLGLITNPSGVDQRLRTTSDLLQAAGQLVALFAPEHGVGAHIQAGEPVAFHRDAQTGLPVYSLYGSTKKPTPEMLDGVDVLIFDLQDVGCRFYTYVQTLLYALEAAAELAREIIVLDRPNPLGGVFVEGGLLEAQFRSFVGSPIPIRYGLTIGELARYFNSALGIGARLAVVPLEGWDPERFGDELFLPWVPPSPNIPKVDTAVVYPGTCLLEGTNLSEGRGTALPFEVVGAPFLDGRRLAVRLNELELPGVAFRPTSFVPAASKYAGELCQGVQIHVTDRRAFRPVRTGRLLVEAAAQLHPEFTFLKPAGDGPCFFDLLAGTDQVRLAVEEGRPLTELLAQWDAEAGEFRRRCQPFYLYERSMPR